VWPQHTWAEHWGLCPYFFWGGELGSHLTQCGLGQGLPPCQVVIHPSDWSQYTNVTDRRDRTDKQDRQRSNSIRRTVFGRPFVKRFARCPVCLSVLSVTLMYCGQSVEWTKIKLGMQRYRPWPRPHRVRWGPSSLHGKGHSSLSTFEIYGFACIRIIRGPFPVCPNGWMDQDAT